MAKSVTKSNVNVKSSAELLSYIINQTPILRENIDLPVQGQSINPIGKIIMNNVAYKNAFLNTINIIGIDVIYDNTNIYLVYSKNEISGVEEEEIIYISKVVVDGGTLKLEEITDDKEWALVQNLLKKIANA